MSTVFVHGCFDLLNVAHVHLLQFAHRQADHLIVGLNSDSSVRRLKGAGRPIYPESERLQLLYAFGADEVIIYDDPTPFQLVVLRRPDVLVVGYDRSLAGRECEYVRDYGGKVVQGPKREGASTSAIIERIRKVPQS